MMRRGFQLKNYKQEREAAGRQRKKLLKSGVLLLLLPAVVLCFSGCRKSEQETPVVSAGSAVESIRPDSGSETAPGFPEQPETATLSEEQFSVELDESGFPVYEAQDELILPADELFTVGRYGVEVPASAEEETAAEEVPAAEEESPADEAVPAGEEQTPEENGADGEDKPEEEPAGTDPEIIEETQLLPGYRNDFFHLAFLLPDGWSMADEELIRDKHRGIPEDISGEALADALKKGGSYCAMYAETEHGEMSSKIVLERIRALARDMITEEELAAGTCAKLETALRDRGTEPLFLGTETIRFMDEDHVCIRIEAMYDSIPVFERQVLLIRGTYIANVFAVSFGTDHTGDILGQYVFLPEQETPDAQGAAALF